MSDEVGFSIPSRDEATVVRASPVSPRSNTMPAAEIRVVKGRNVEDLERLIGELRLQLAHAQARVLDLEAELETR